MGKGGNDLSRALGKPFLFAVFGCMLCLLFSAFSPVLSLYQNSELSVSLYYHRQITLSAMGGKALLFSLPVLSTVPFSGAFVEDVKSGYLKAYLPRTTVTRYIAGKELACALSGGLAPALGIVLGHILITLLVIPFETFSDVPMEPLLGALLGRIALFALSGALFASLGMLFSTVTMNSYMAYASPFILYYVLIILQERYFRDSFMLNPQNYLTLAGAWPFGGLSAALTVLVLLVCVMLGFF